MKSASRHTASALVLAIAAWAGGGMSVAAPLGPLNSPVRSQDPAKFNSKAVLDHLAPIIWQGDNLAYTQEAGTIHPAQTAYARMMNKKIQEVVPGKIYLASGFQLASTMIAVGDKGLIVIDPGSDDDSARATFAAFKQAVPAAANLPVVAVVYSHRHPDHAFGPAGFGVTQADIDAGKVKIIASVDFVKDLVNDVWAWWVTS